MVRDWLERLAGRVEIDWSGFAVTRGCFLVGFDPIEVADERADKRPVGFLRASGGMTTGVPRWAPWARWYHLPRLCDPLPPVAAPCGSVSYPRSIP